MPFLHFPHLDLHGATSCHSLGLCNILVSSVILTSAASTEFKTNSGARKKSWSPYLWYQSTSAVRRSSAAGKSTEKEDPLYELNTGTSWQGQVICYFGLRKFQSVDLSIQCTVQCTGGGIPLPKVKH